MPELSYGALPVPATPIGGLTRWQLDIRCSGCRRHVPLRIADLVGPYGAKMRIAEANKRPGPGCPCGLARQLRENWRRVRDKPPRGPELAVPARPARLLPVPAAILRLRPAHPTALVWLAEHEASPTGCVRLRAVRDKATAGRRLPQSRMAVRYSVFTHQATPDAAITQLAALAHASVALQRRPLD
jgi:hypothetical protein